MKIYSFDTNSAIGKIKRDPEQDNLFDLFQKNIVNDQKISFRVYVVPREFEMRLDRICEHLYGSTNFVEELMTFNNIINPYSIKEGQLIYYCDQDLMNNLYVKDELLNTTEKTRKDIIKSSQSKRNAVDNELLPPTIKPSNLNQISVNNKDNSIKIINSFK